MLCKPLFFKVWTNDGISAIGSLEITSLGKYNAEEKLWRNWNVLAKQLVGWWGWSAQEGLKKERLFRLFGRRYSLHIYPSFPYTEIITFLAYINNQRRNIVLNLYTNLTLFSDEEPYAVHNERHVYAIMNFIFHYILINNQWL